eukprot:TRINITY_DN1280_c0_g1_i1.p1 TRINITY_DN1280_c0_g1~~TRINITY_DN1280_c0_g1_i1.p1  ORF type:complete len:165 (-),score=34.26 TRINITY_DN1280_c0_g1_i1:23-517(-)
MQRVMVFNRPIQAKRRSSNMKLLRLSHPKKVVAPVMPQRQRGAIRKMSEEEKAKRLADMMVDADLHESTRRTMQAKEDEYAEAKQKEDDAARKQEQEEGFVQAKFIRFEFLLIHFIFYFHATDGVPCVNPPCLDQVESGEQMDFAQLHAIFLFYFFSIDRVYLL